MSGALTRKSSLSCDRPLFDREYRLTKPDQFKFSLDSRPFARSACFNMHWRATSEAPSTAKLGLIIPKRLVRSAVRRNTIKRVIREAFRVSRVKLPPGYLVFKLKAPIEACSLTQTKRVVHSQVHRLLNNLYK